MKPILTLLTTLLLAPLGALPAAVGEGQSAQSDVLLTNRKAWEDLAARGNPLLLLNAERFQNPQPAFKLFGGYAICGANRCPNIIVRSDLPPSLDYPEYTPEYLGWVTLHEFGHALGLGHATNLWESTDLMGYGWPQLGDPVLSDCDIEALAFVFGWAVEGSEPYPPGEGPYSCDSD